MFGLTRRACVWGGGIAMLGATGVAPAQTVSAAQVLRRLPISDPVYSTRVVGRLQGDLSGRQRWLYNPGFVYATRPGRGLAPAEFARLLYRVEGFTSRISRTAPDGSVDEVSSSWMFYKHPTEERYLERFDNPYTGRSLAVPPYRGGASRSRLSPVSGVVRDGASGLESTAIGVPVALDWRAQGEQVHITRHAASRMRGSTDQVRNEFSIDAWVCRADHLAEESLTHLPSVYSWTSQAQWQPWLEMGDEAGGLTWRIETVVLDSVAELPEPFTRRMSQLLPGKLSERLQF